MNFNFKEAFLIFIRGILMGSADIVPGVSGGTIALITGIYDHLVEAISNINFGFIKPLFKGDFKGFWNQLLEEIDFKLGNISSNAFWASPACLVAVST